MSQVYVGNLDPNFTASDIEREFRSYGDIRSVKLPRNGFGGYAFVEFKDRRDALNAIREWNGKFGWRVELSRNSQWVSASFGGGGGGGRGGGRVNCYSCGEPGHFARDCPTALDKKKKGGQVSQRGRKKDQIASSSIWKPVPPPPPPWLELPEDITAKILHKVGATEILETAQKVCTTWRRICKDPLMWRVIDMSNLGDFHDMDYDLEKMCRHAVDLSQGQLVDINIEYFGTDELLEYIAQRSGQLRRLRLACCDDLTGEGLSKAVKDFPLLEELNLQFTSIDKEDIEAIGLSCPKLKSFTLNERGCKHGLMESNAEALAVAQCMPELHHLGLCGNKMTNVGLQTILESCPKLESLDIRQCFNVYLQGELGKRCAQQIKNLRRPHDSIQDWRAYLDDCPYMTSDDDSYYDYDYDDLEYDDFCDPYRFSDGSEASLFEEMSFFY